VSYSAKFRQDFSHAGVTSFDAKKLKKAPSKVAHNRPKPFFPQPSPSHSQQPKIDFSYHQNVPPDICSLICDLKAETLTLDGLPQG